jgi:hypothetical protein
MELRFRNVDGAIRALDKCIEANPDDAKTRCFLTLAKADVYSRGSDGEKARQVYGEAMDEFKDDERVYYRALSFEMSHRGALVLEVSFAASSTAACGHWRFPFVHIARGTRSGPWKQVLTPKLMLRSIETRLLESGLGA